MTRFRRNPDIEAAPMQDEAVLFSPATKKFCLLNETAAFLWKLLEQPKTEEELSTELCREYDGVDAAVAARDVRQTLQQLTELKIVAPA